jgi:hypothetical protein
MTKSADPAISWIMFVIKSPRAFYLLGLIFKGSSI